MKKDGMQGQGLLEYVMILILVAVFVIIAVRLFGQSTGNLFSNVVANF